MDRIAEVGEVNPGKKEDNLQDLYKLSFRFAQGFTEVQENIMLWLVGSHYLTKEDFSHEPEFLKQLKRPRQHIQIGNENTFVSVWNTLSKTVEKNQVFELDLIEKKLLDGMIFAEDEYLRRGRLGRDEHDHVIPDSPQDKFGSLIRKYVVLENSTGSDAFDDLMANLRNLSNESPDLLKDIAIKWETNHPGQKFYL